MLPLLKPRLRDDGLLAVCFDRSGVAVALVRREPDRPPSLSLCEFHTGATGEQQTSAMAELRGRAGLKDWPCVSLVGTDDYHLLLVERPDVPAAEITDATRWRLKDRVDYPVDNAVVDVIDVPPDKNGKQNLLYAVVAPREVIQARSGPILDAGFQLNAIDIPELAYRNLVCLMPENAGGVAFVEFGSKFASLTVTYQGVLYLSRRIEPGLADLATVNVALNGTLEGRLDAAIIEIQRSLDYYESHYGQPSVAGIVLAPGARDIPRIDDYLSSQLGIPTRILDLNQLIECETALDSATQVNCLAAVGAALAH